MSISFLSMRNLRTTGDEVEGKWGAGVVIAA